MINNAGNEPVVKEAEETGGIKRIEYKSPSWKKFMPLFNPVSTRTRTNDPTMTYQYLNESKKKY